MDNHRQLNHILPFEFFRTYEGNDIARFSRRGRQFIDKTGIYVPEHIHPQIRCKIMTLVDNDKRIKI